MTVDIAVMILVAALLLWQLWLRTHAPLVTFAACAGFVLTTTWGSELITQVGRVWPLASQQTGHTVITLLLFLLPPTITIFQFRGSMGHRWLQQFPPAVFGAFFLVVFSFRFLPISTQQDLLDKSYVLAQLNNFASWIVLLAIGVATVELLSQHDLLKARSPRKH